ncbi:apolipoprotein N-acyltransferase [Oceanobacter mangrovi]|uniref:apolipoprotein N-acyltransferase n=1 Tax=Oceanobacter mangrovi TaxID=2862510 RepID=UPI001C8ED252|nr:apolipoprotein N-acyltransferase [Oceanobacter mangrovi]
MIKFWTSRLSLLAAGAIFPLSLAPLYWWPLGLVSIAVFCWLMWRPASPAQAFGRSWWYFFGQFAAGVSWVYVSMHDFGGTSMPLAVLMVGLFAGALALVPAIVFSGYARLRRPNSNTPVLPWLLLPVFWFLDEWLRSWLFTGFPWLFAGDGQLYTWLAGWAPVIGSYGISVILVLTVTTLIQAWYSKRLVFLLPLLLWPAGLWLQQFDWTHVDGKITVSAVQGNIDQNMKWKPDMVGPTINLYVKQTQKLWDSDLIVWPETAVTLVYDRFLPYLEELNAQGQKHNSTIITGIAYRHPQDDPLAGEYHNSVVATGMGHGLYHKQRLVPFGEFIPFEKFLRGAIPFFDLDMSSFLAGRSDQPLIQMEANNQLYDVATYICYEIAYPDLVSRMAKQAEILVTVSNDAWFGDSLGPKQHMGLAQMRALETGRYLLRSTNTGITALVNNRGQIVEQLPTGIRANLTARAELRSGQTPYMQTGLLPLYILSAIALLIALGMSMTRRPQGRSLLDDLD